MILTEPNGDGDVVLTNWTTAGHQDWQVEFRPKDNPKLFTEKCTPNYHDIDFYPLSDLMDLPDYVFCPENLTEKVIIGAFWSQHTPIGVLEELAAQYPVLAAENYTP